MPISHRSQSSFSLNPGADQELTLFERALRMARRNWLLLLICIAVAPAAALVYSLLQTPEYTATASVLFTDDVSESDPERVAATNLQFGSLEQIAAQTAEALPSSGYSAAKINEEVEAEPAGISNVIDLSATDPDPQLAAQISNEFAKQLIAFRRSASKERILESQASVDAQLEQMSPEERNSPEGEALTDRSRQLAVRAATQTGEAQIVQEAIPPDSPSSPRTSLNVALGLLLGLALGIGLALVRDQLDRRLKDSEEVEQTFGLPILATVPSSPSFGTQGITAEAAGEEREAFRMLRANLQYFNLAEPVNAGIKQPVNSILVTSPSSQDGKTTVSWNLAVAEARTGERVLYLEADLRRPTLAAQLGLPLEQDAGLSLVLAGVLEPGAAVRNAQGVDVICAGPLPPNPAELLDSSRLGDLLAWAQENYDRVVIDTPPTAVVADAIPLTTQVDGVIVVVRLRHSPRSSAEHLADQLANTNAPTLGVVINGVSRSADDSYYRSPANGDSFSQAYERLSSGQGAKSAPPSRRGA